MPGTHNPPIGAAMLRGESVCGDGPSTKQAMATIPIVHTGTTTRTEDRGLNSVVSSWTLVGGVRSSRILPSRIGWTYVSSHTGMLPKSDCNLLTKVRHDSSMSCTTIHRVTIYLKNPETNGGEAYVAESVSGRLSSQFPSYILLERR